MGNRGTPGFDPERLRRHRERLGINQAELARHAGVGRAAVTKYESGYGAPNVDRLADIAAALNVEPLDLIDAGRLGHGLVSLRVAAGLKQEQVAEQAGPDWTVSRYRMLELGHVRRLTHADADLLAEVFGVTPDIVRRAHQWDLEQGGQR